MWSTNKVGRLSGQPEATTSLLAARTNSRVTQVAAPLLVAHQFLCISLTNCPRI